MGWKVLFERGLAVWAGLLAMVAMWVISKQWLTFDNAMNSLSAVATAAAAIIALYLGLEGQRSAKSKELQVALLSAAAATVHLERMLHKVEYIRFSLDPEPRDYRDEKTIADRIRSIDLKGIADDCLKALPGDSFPSLQSLLPINNRCALRIQMAVTTLDRLEADIRVTEEIGLWDILTEKDGAEQLEEWQAIAKSVRIQIKLAGIECTKATGLKVKVFS